MSPPIKAILSELLWRNPHITNFPPTESALNGTAMKIQTHLEFGGPFKAPNPKKRTKSFRANKRPLPEELKQEPPAKKARTESPIPTNEVSSSSAEINSVNVKFITHEIQEHSNSLFVEISLTNGRKTKLNLSLDYFNNHIVKKISGRVPTFNINGVEIEEYQCMKFHSNSRKTFQYTIRIKLNNGLISEKMLFQRPYSESNRLKVNTELNHFNKNNEEFIDLLFNIPCIDPVSIKIPLNILENHKKITINTRNRNQSIHPIRKVKIHYSNESIHVICYTKDGDKHTFLHKRTK